MSRGLGTALTLSALGHGVAVLTIGVAVVWLVGAAPLSPPPPALYVDVVNPIVATSDRHETGATNAPPPSGAGGGAPRTRGDAGARGRRRRRGCRP